MYSLKAQNISYLALTGSLSTSVLRDMPGLKLYSLDSTDT